ncbi:MAG: peptidoglycan recognition family protein [Elusimicrobiota bacterium]
MPVLSFVVLTAALASAAVEVEPTPITFRGAAIAGEYAVNYPPLDPKVFFEFLPSDPISVPFDTVLFHGVLPDPGVGFEASLKPKDGSWGPWVKAEIHRFPNGRFWAKALVSAPGGGELRLRVVDNGVSATHTLELFEAEVLQSPGKGGKEKEAAAPAESPDKPTVVGRSQWGAKPPKGDYTEHQPVRITQHHTAGRQPFTLKDATDEMLFTQDFHQNGRGWLDIGYHFLMDGEGRIFQGRPETVVGTHVGNQNTGNIGISLMGYYHEPKNHQVSQAQLDSLAALGRWLTRNYKISPDAYKAHRDLSATACPGDIAYALMDRIRDSFRQAPVSVRADAAKPVQALLDSARRPPERVFDGKK